MPKSAIIKPYKFVNPNMISGGMTAKVKRDGEKGGATIIAAGKKITGPKEEGTAAVKVGRTTLLAFNRIGFTLYSIGKAQASWAKLIVGEGQLIKENQAFRRRKKQYLRDQESEAKQESQPGLKPVKEDGKKEVEKKEKKEQSWLEKLFAPFRGLIEFALRVMITQGILRWIADPKNTEGIQTFVDTAATVFNFLFNVAYKSIDFFLTGVSNVLGNGEAQGFDRFKQVMTGLGQILIGIAGFKALSYLNPFNLIGDLLKLIDWFSGNTGKQQELPAADAPDGKPKPDAPDGKPKPKPDAPTKPKKGIMSKIGDKFSDMKKGFMGAVDSTKKGILSGWDNIKKIGGSISKGVRDKLARSTEWAKKAVQDKLKPIAKGAYDILEKKGIISTAKKLGKTATDTIQKVPGYSKVMKKVSEEGGQAMLKKIGGKAIPIIGGLVNLYFAYDRLKSGDKSGAALEALSAILDLSGLFGFVPGPALSMALDAYLFGRDFFPDVVKKENEFFDKIMNGILAPIRAVQDMLPKVPMLAEGGIVNKPTLAILGERGPEAVVPLNGSASSSDKIAETMLSSIQGSLDRMGPGGEVAKQLLAGELGGIKNSLGIGSVLSVGGGDSISKTVAITQRNAQDKNIDPAEALIGLRSPSFSVGKTSNKMDNLRGALANVLGVFSEITTKDFKSGSGSSSSPSGGADDDSGGGGDTSSSNISLTNTDYLKLMVETMNKGGITDRNERIMFMAQVGHESGEGRYMEEIASGAAYEGRSDLGNTQPGDGKRFKGRGYIQITGRANYKKYGPMIGVADAVKNPQKLAEPQNAAKVALAYWKDRVNRAAAKKGLDGMNTVTRNINGGLNGLDDRIAKFKKYQNNQAIQKAAMGGAVQIDPKYAKLTVKQAENKSKTDVGRSVMDRGSNVPFDSRAFGGLLKFAKGGRVFNGFTNGSLPDSQLASIGHGAKLHKNAAPKWQELVDAAKKDGVDLKPGGPGGYAYRDYAEQVALVKKYGLWSPSNPGAAQPGTSNHGWGTAVDVHRSGWSWIRKNAKKFGWRGISNEAWHIDLDYKKVYKGELGTGPATSSNSDSSSSGSDSDTKSGGDTEAKSKEQILADMAKAFDKLNNILYGTPMPNEAAGVKLPDKVWINKKTGEISLKEPPTEKKSEFEEKKTADLTAEQKTKVEKAMPKPPPSPVQPSKDKPQAPAPAVQQTFPPGALVPGQRADKALTREQFKAVQQARQAAKQMGLTGMDKERFIAKAAMDAGTSGASISQASQNAQVSQTIEDSAVTTVPVPINTGSAITMVGGHSQTQVIRPQSQITRGFG